MPRRSAACADAGRHTSSASLPESFEGVLIANELLDALPVHQVVMREDGLREVFVVAVADRRRRLTTVEGPPSTPALAAYLARLGVALEPGGGPRSICARSNGSATPAAAFAADF